VFIVEFTTTQGPVSERYETYAEARQRVEQFPADHLQGMVFIYQQLPDGSERLVRDDGKPLQVHRVLQEEAEASEEPLPLAEDGSALLGPDGKLRIIERQPFADDEDNLPLA
jgi:hypothetical protein